MSLAIIFCGLTLSASNVNADETSGEFTYTVNSDTTTVTITGYIGSSRSLEIPSTIDGKSVTEIGVAAFSNKQLTSVIIPSSVKSIDILHLAIKNTMNNQL